MNFAKVPVFKLLLTVGILASASSLLAEGRRFSGCGGGRIISSGRMAPYYSAPIVHHYPSRVVYHGGWEPVIIHSEPSFSYGCGGSQVIISDRVVTSDWAPTDGWVISEGPTYAAPRYQASGTQPKGTVAPRTNSAVRTAPAEQNQREFFSAPKTNGTGADRYDGVDFFRVPNR